MLIIWQQIRTHWHCLPLYSEHCFYLHISRQQYHNRRLISHISCLNRAEVCTWNEGYVALMVRGWRQLDQTMKGKRKENCKEADRFKRLFLVDLHKGYIVSSRVLDGQSKGVQTCSWRVTVLQSLDPKKQQHLHQSIKVFRMTGNFQTDLPLGHWPQGAGLGTPIQRHSQQVEVLSFCFCVTTSAFVNYKIWICFERFADWLLWLLAVKESDSKMFM